jgi:hypothetical protein
MELLVERLNKDALAPSRIVRVPMKIRELHPEPQWKEVVRTRDNPVMR